MPYLDSNMPSKIFNALINSEILRIVRRTTDPIDMVKADNLLLTWMKKQGNDECNCIISL